MTQKDIHSYLTANPANKIAEVVDGIPPLPFIVTFVLELTDDDDLSVVSLAHALEADPGLTARVLRISNSAFYSPVERVYTVRDAITYVGFETVRSLAVTATMVNGLWVEHDIFSKQVFWRHSLRCGLFARKIAMVMKLKNPDVLFTIGVLHDIGRAAAIQYSPDNYRNVLDLMRSKGIMLWEAENEVLGTNHAEIGGILAEKWKLPPAYSSVIAHHHDPGNASDYQSLAHIIALADALAHSASPKDRQGYITPPLIQTMWSPLGLDEPSVRSIYNERETIEEHTKSLYETASVG